MDTVDFRSAAARSAAALERTANDIRQMTRPAQLAPGNIVRVRELADAARATCAGLVTDARKLVGRTQDAPISVELGAGIVQVLRLDDDAVRRSYGRGGVVVEPRNAHRVVVIGDREALASLTRHAAQKAGCDDVALWQRASASSAVKQLEVVLRG